MHLRRDGDVGGLTNKYLLFLGLARFLRLLFWVAMWNRGESFPALMVADFLHCFLLGDFVIGFYKNLRGGSSLPSHKRKDL